MLDSHSVQVHVVLVRFLVVLQLRFEPVQGVLQHCTAFWVTLLIYSIILLGFDVLTVEDVFDWMARSGEAAEGRLGAPGLHKIAFWTANCLLYDR